MLQNAQREILEAGWTVFDFGQEEDPVPIAIRMLGARSSQLSVVRETIVPKLVDEARANSISAVFGLSEIPPHTDGAHLKNPPKYLLMWMNEVDTTETSTAVFEFNRKYLPKDWVLDFEKSIWAVKVRSDRYFYACPVSRDLSIRWDPGCFIVPRRGKLTRANVIEMLHTLPSHRIQLGKNRALLLDNWRVLHGRDSVVGPNYMRRKLLRVSMFEAENAMGP
jgi:hypothetical protein